MDFSLPLDRMTNLEKISMMEKLWEDLSSKPEEIQSPEWHRDVLLAREQAVKEGKASFLSIAKAKEKIRNRCK